MKSSAEKDAAAPPRCVILLYHRVARLATDPFWLAVRPKFFDEHMRILRETSLCVPLCDLHAQMRDGKLNRSAVAVTFDDGYTDNYLHALPILTRHAISATVFVATGLLDTNEEIWSDELDRILLQPGKLPQVLELKTDGGQRRFDLNGSARLGWLRSLRGSYRGWRAWFNEDPTPRHRAFRELWRMLQPLNPASQRQLMHQLRQLANVPIEGRRTHRWMTHAELQALARSPLIEIGGHTVHHPSLAHQSEQLQRDEIAQCRKDLEARLQREVTSFAYPFGGREDFSHTTKSIVRDCGYQRACSNYTAAAADAPSDDFDLPRVVVQDWPGEEFKRRLERWLGEQVRNY